MKQIIFIIFIGIVVHTDAQTCPNGDFEIWNPFVNYALDSGWSNSNMQSLIDGDTLTVWSVAGLSGRAVHMENEGKGSKILEGWITTSEGDPMLAGGGIPYTGRPRAITGYYRFDLPGNDSAILLVIFKKRGGIVGWNKFMIRNSAGSLWDFTRFSFPLTITNKPDKVIVAAMAGNIYGNDIEPGSWLELDALAFADSNTVRYIPVGNFDDWVRTPVLMPDGWSTACNFNMTGVSRATDAYSGDGSIALTTMPYFGNNGYKTAQPAEITNGKIDRDAGAYGGLPYSQTSDTLFGHYKYFPVGDDTAVINITLTAGGNEAGGGWGGELTAANTWTKFAIPISATTQPDTMLIDIASSRLGGSTAGTGSTLYLDHLWLKSQPLSVSELFDASCVKIYPNPANDMLNFKFTKEIQGMVSIMIYDENGLVLDRKKFASLPSLVTFLVGSYPKGRYEYEIKNNYASYKASFTKE